MDITGVYSIRCRYNNRINIGSAKDIISKRWSCHKSNLQSGKHTTKIQEDYNTYGISGFEWTIIEECDDDRKERESYWKEYYQNLGFEVYNIREIKSFN